MSVTSIHPCCVILETWCIHGMKPTVRVPLPPSCTFKILLLGITGHRIFVNDYTVFLAIQRDSFQKIFSKFKRMAIYNWL